MENSKDIIIAVVSAISGGGLASFFTFKTNLKKQQLLEVREVLEANRILREELGERILILEERIETMRETEIKLRGEISALKMREAKRIKND